MAGSLFVLVAEDPRLTVTLQGHLHRALGHLLPTTSFTDLRQQLGPDTPGLLVLAAATAPTALLAARLVQEIALRQWPVSIVLIEAEAACDGPDLVSCDPYVARRLRWPDQANELTALLKPHANRLAEQATGNGSDSLERVIGRRLLCHSPSLLPMVDRLALAASHDVTVLWTGETGTGKTYLAQLMHQCSPRREHRFLTVPCGALASNLIESEFFGHVKGAFTGADRPKLGKFAAVGQGTLLLDEIDALGLEQQANLLRVIETGEYEPVGSNETQHCTARVMVASNWNLEEAVERGKFRQDLYYRLNVMAFHLPPLRERVEDIAPLVRTMTTRFSQKFQKPLHNIHPETITALEMFPWPGNIRQLENVVQQAVLVSSGAELLLHHLPEPVQEYAALRHGLGRTTGDSLAQSREAVERSVIQRTLISCGYSRARAASALGISRVTLYKKMKKYDLMAVPLSPHQSE